ncbi:MAG: class I SAM-dependent methyltransferase [Alphaproteobacteria bacterium]|nr:class I SAM-dependent methyltransferase [Alphaproteobacteria bacterium]
MNSASNHPCPSCGATGLSVFYEVAGVPAHSVLLLRSRDSAVGFPSGDIALAFCPTCTFICNLAFDPALEQYGGGYEGTQAYSATFNAFHRELAERLIEKHGLYGKTIIEIGCGQGEFLSLLCEIGGNRGIGFDPAYEKDRAGSSLAEGSTVIADFYSERYADRPSDFVCCKMTLEHIPETAAFVSTVRRSIGARPNATVFFLVPNALRILEQIAFWDIYYEHCSYFGTGSLAYLFNRCGFDVLEQGTAYDEQYLMLEARPSTRARPPDPPAGQTAIAAAVQNFRGRSTDRIAAWRNAIAELSGQGRRPVLWGGGSKAVAFLTTLGIGPEIAGVVDINPHKHGTFLPGTGHEVLPPEALAQIRPQLIVVMNPIYLDEIGQQVQRMALAPEIVPVTAAPSDLLRRMASGPADG